MKKEKRGITNIEMIVAVTIFIFSVILVIYYITFVGLRQEPAEIFLATLEKALRNETEVTYNITYLETYGGSQGMGDCINVSRHLSIVDVLNVSIIEHSQNSRVNFNVTSDWLLINNSGSSSHTFEIYAFPYKINANDELNCNNIISLVEGQGYNYSIVSEGKVFVYDKLSNLDYKTFKERWNMQKDFYISVMNATGTALFAIGTPASILGVPVRASQFKAKMIFPIGNINDIMINLQVW
ncbi:MAG: hypothetical protein ACPLXC_02760 [Candidatus Pacearchaeota archaeon]